MSQDTRPISDSQTDPAYSAEVVAVCLNGHWARSAARPDASASPVHCSICGAETITGCRGCRETILGLGEGGDGTLTRVPQYCSSCGRPFPWTERAMSAARAVIRELASLDQYERDQLRRSIDHIIRETPQTQVAILRIRQALARIGGDTADQLREMLRSVANERVRAQLFPDAPG